MGRPNMSRDTNFSGANEDREKIVFPVQLTTTRSGNLTRLIHTLLEVMTIHAYILHNIPNNEEMKKLIERYSLWQNA